MRGSFSISVGLLALLSLAAAGCDDDEPTASTLSGTIAQSSFTDRTMGHPVQAILTDASDGAKTQIFLDREGVFTLSLTEDRTYQLLLQQDGPSIPVAFAGAHGQYDVAIDVRSGGAAVDLGLIRFFDTTAAGSPSDVCVGGYFDGTTEPCISGDAKVACSHHGDDDDDDDHEDGWEDDEGEDDDDWDRDDWDRDGGDRDGWSQPELVPVDGAIGIPELGISGSLGCKGHHDDDDDHEHEFDGEEEGDY